MRSFSRMGGNARALHAFNPRNSAVESVFIGVNRC